MSTSQCVVYGSMGAHISTILETEIFDVVGPCEEGRPGGAARGTALDHHPGVGCGGCGGGPSCIHHDIL